jgi:hypothetical protein
MPRVKDAGAILQARAICIQAALVTRREGWSPADICAVADQYWDWVSTVPGPAAGNPLGPADLAKAPPKAGRVLARQRVRSAGNPSEVS